MYNAVRDSGLNIKAYDFPVFTPEEKGNWTSSHQFTIPVQPKQDEERVKACLDFIKDVYKRQRLMLLSLYTSRRNGFWS